ncbi:MAG: efflux RND transporter periplasmic adaptor subunit [Gammaproteobacteria bacterium SHHR-1]|uniref:efflux RND transporter periplasmic adaptor subunit n=1 Tax=Magnetovirga frankeli TaxID=947516 RepID=UPI0012937EC9|nr:efflux RND transporter periplasmic adaptor subunit [gamma proteobacterium SS-5]
MPDSLKRLHPLAWSVILSVSLLVCTQQAVAAKGPGGPEKVPAVKVVTLDQEPVPMRVELPGRTTPFLIAELRPQVSGIIQERLFDEGSEVEAGQVLYRIDPALYQAAVDLAEADLARAEAERHAARLKAERNAELVQRQVGSQQEFDDADAALRMAEAEVAAAQAVLAKARIDLGYTQVRSPISGRIGRSAVTVGALVTANQPQALATVQQLNPIYVDLTQSNTEVSRIRRELNLGPLHRQQTSFPVQLLLDDGVEYRHSGRLAFSEVTVDEQTGSITLRARFDNPEGELLPGMYVRAAMTLGQREQAMRVPHKAVTRDTRGRPQVMLVDEQNKVQLRPITTVQSMGSDWIVTEGLKPGDRIIVEGLQRARPGGEVKVEDPNAVTIKSPAGQE